MWLGWCNDLGYILRFVCFTIRYWQFANVGEKIWYRRGCSCYVTWPTAKHIIWFIKIHLRQWFVSSYFWKAVYLFLCHVGCIIIYHSWYYSHFISCDPPPSDCFTNNTMLLRNNNGGFMRYINLQRVWCNTHINVTCYTWPMVKKKAVLWKWKLLNL